MKIFAGLGRGKFLEKLEGRRKSIRRSSEIEICVQFILYDDKIRPERAKFGYVFSKMRITSNENERSGNAAYSGGESGSVKLRSV